MGASYGRRRAARRRPLSPGQAGGGRRAGTRNQRGRTPRVSALIGEEPSTQGALVSAEEDQDDPWLRFEHQLDRKLQQAKPMDWDEMQRLVDLGASRLKFIEPDTR
jgi:hypothetical protein